MTKYHVSPAPVCLTCRKQGPGLSCTHPKLVCREMRAPRTAAGRGRWQMFVDWLNHRVAEGAVYWDDGSRVTGALTL